MKVFSEILEALLKRRKAQQGAEEGAEQTAKDAAEHEADNAAREEAKEAAGHEADNALIQEAQEASGDIPAPVRGVDNAAAITASQEERRRPQGRTIEEAQEEVGQRAFPVTTDMEAQGVIDTLKQDTPVDRGRTPTRNINLDYLDPKTGEGFTLEDEEDVFRLLDHMSTQEGPKSFDAVREGAETEQNKILTVLLKRKKGDLLNDQQMLAARRLMVTLTNDIREMSKTLVSNPQATPDDYLAFRRKLAVVKAVQASVQGATKEIGRALNAFKITAQPLDAGVVDALNQQLDNPEMIRSMSRRQDTARMTLEATGGVDAARYLASKIAQTKDPEKVAEAINQTAFARTKGAIYTFWLRSLLWNVPTQLGNLAGNTIYQSLVIPPERAIASGYSWLREKANWGGWIPGKFRTESGGFDPSDAVYKDEMWISASAILEAFTKANQMASRAWVTRQPSDQAMKLDLSTRNRFNPANIPGVNPGSPIYKMLSMMYEVMDLSFGALLTADEWYKGYAYNMELFRLARRESRAALSRGEITEGELLDYEAKVIEALPDQMHWDSLDFSEYVTFTKPLYDVPPGGTIESLGKGVALFRNQFTPSKVVFLFNTTPTRIFSAIGERNPVTAPITQEFRDNMMAGGAKADLAMARLTYGMMTASLVYMLTDGPQPILTGSGPGGRWGAEWRKMGYQEWSLRKGDKYWSLKRLDPLGGHIGVMANMMDRLRYETDPVERDRLATMIVVSMAEAYKDKNMMKSFADLIYAMQYEASLEGWIARQAASVMSGPRAIAQGKKIIDQTARDTRHPDILQRTWNEMKVNSPWGDSTTLPPRLDMWGREWVREVTFFEGMINPLYTSESSPLDEATVFALAYNSPPEPACTVSWGAADVDLFEHDRPAEGRGSGAGWACHDFRKAVGQARYEVVQDMLAGSGPLGAELHALDPNDNEGIIAMLDKAYALGRKQGRERFLEDYPSVEAELEFGEDQPRQPPRPLPPTETPRSIRMP